jgi:methyl-accepting chemotaxis protein
MAISAGCIILCVIILALFASTAVSRLNSGFKQLLKHEVTTKIETIKVGREVNYVSRLTRNIMLGADFDKDAKRLDETIGKIEASFKKMAAAAKNAEEKSLIDQAHADALAFVNDGRSRVLATKDMPASERHSIFAEYEKYATPLAMKSRASFETIIKNADKQYDTTVLNFSQTISNAQKTIMTLSIAAVFVSVILFSILIRSIIKPIQLLNKQLNEIADGEGDLTKRLDEGRTDELGQLSISFNRFASKLQGIFSHISRQSSSVTTATNRMHTIAAQLSQGTDETAAQTSTVATASEEMSATSNDIAQNCYRAAESAQSAVTITQKGFDVVSHTVAGIRTRGEKTKENAAIIASLGDRSNQIGEIVATIEDIADQTNLLALNAAIEAARAGEMGRGFAVVADEVRALAERTTKATKEISQMIKTIQGETRQAITAMDEGVRGTEQGAAEAATIETALQNILEQVNDVTMQISQIATAAEEQTATTSEITSNMHKVSNVIDETSQEAKNISAIAEELNTTADELQRLMKQFNC